jgi:hypothetical protein
MHSPAVNARVNLKTWGGQISGLKSSLENDLVNLNISLGSMGRLSRHSEAPTLHHKKGGNE